MPRPRKDPNAPQVSKAERFKADATDKMSRALDAIAKVGLVANTRTGEWTQEQANRMKAALNAEVERTMKHFEVKAEGTVSGFSFDTPEETALEETWEQKAAREEAERIALQGDAPPPPAPAPAPEQKPAK